MGSIGGVWRTFLKQAFFQKDKEDSARRAGIFILLTSAHIIYAPTSQFLIAW